MPNIFSLQVAMHIGPSSSMTTLQGVFRFALALATFAVADTAWAAFPNTIVLVDGHRIEGEVLFRHPYAPLLVVRSSKNSTVQSLDLDVIQSVKVNGRITPFSAPRALTEAESARFRANGAWGDDVGKGNIGRYATENWDRKPLIVWARPGESGNALEAESWLDETGKPLAKSPWKLKGDNGEFDGDILLPASETAYTAIQPGNRDHLGLFTLRHLTIERNASYAIRYLVLGNLWMKDGAKLGANTQTGDLGSRSTNKNTFLRVCAVGWPEDPKAGFGAISHWVVVDTGSGSLEVIGRCGGAGDRARVRKDSTLVVSEDSYFGSGPRASFLVEEGATVVLLDGAAFGCNHLTIQGGRATYGIAGTLLFGTNEHPLTRDLMFRGSRYDIEALEPDAVPSERTAGATFVLGKTGRMIVNSADPRTARVVFCSQPEDAYREKWFAPGFQGRILPPGVSAVFAGKTDFNGVMFDNFTKDSIVVSPNKRSLWRNVFFGDHNSAPPEELFRAEK